MSTPKRTFAHRNLPLLLLQALFVGSALARNSSVELVVTAPYLEMHTGPGRGYPVFYVVGRGETLVVLYSRTDWYKVRAPRGQEGLVLGYVGE